MNAFGGGLLRMRRSATMSMSGNNAVVPILLLLLCCLNRLAVAYEDLVASFYGDSYLKIPVKDSRSDTDVRLHFRTTRSDAVLLLAAGAFDYCLVSLRSGALFVHLDLGSGEAVLSSPADFTFNDAAWHSVYVRHRQGNVTLVIDGQRLSSVVTPGSFFELNIDKHLYAGGIPETDRSLVVANVPAFRGCMRGVTFNGIGVFGTAKEETNRKNAHAVTWDCRDEFFVASSHAISFLDDISFIAFSLLNIPRFSSMRFELRTKSQYALLVFSSGPYFDSDFFAVEIVAGKLRLTCSQRAYRTVISSETAVSDGNWHSIEVTSDGTSIALAVNKSRQLKQEITSTQVLHRGSPLYVGGVGVKAKAVASYQHLESIRRMKTDGGSMLRCVKDFTINAVGFGFQEASISKTLAPGCLLNHTCSGNSCEKGIKCNEETTGNPQHCVCRDDHCTSIQMDESANDDILRVMELVVTEGRRVALTAENIIVSEEYKAAGIKDSQVIFQVINSPSHGEIFINSDTRMSDRVQFSMSDLMSQHVTYIHDDSEGAEDSIGLQLEFASVASSAPEKFHRKYGVTLMIKVLPNNDRPDLILPANNSLVIISGSPVKMTARILNVSDADDSPSDLEYIILSSGLGGFEMMNVNGSRAKVTRFTHGDVLDGKVRYSQKGAFSQEVKLRVSDGRHQSMVKTLKVTAVPLELNIVSNTGLVIRHGTAQTITRFNLSTVTNAAHQDIEIRYDVTDPPREGEIQRQQNTDGQWTKANDFLQKHVDRNRLRYIHHGKSQSGDDLFQFRVSALDVETQEFEFRIQVIETKVSLLHCTGLHLKGAREGIIGSESLMAVSTVPHHQPQDVVYRVIATPTKGHLFRLERRGSGQPQKRRLAFADNFTQAEVNEGRIGYKFQKALYSPMMDDFEFILVIPGAQSGVSLFALSYEPIEGAFRFVNNGLFDVFEGERKVITSEDLFTEKRDVRNFRYTVTDGADHGVLQLFDLARNLVIQNNITTFTNDDIKERKVYYQHDDSETDDDMFSFTTTPIIDQPKHAVLEITELSGTFEIKIVLKNDNAPKREVERVFNVVANRGRVITSSDIWYSDPDVNYDSLRLEYELLNITNGHIVLAENHSVSVYRFMQKDIEAGRLYFRHRGPLYGRSVVWVTDGQFFSTGILEVRASEPFVRAQNMSEIVVQKGQVVDLHPKYFNVETNLDTEDENIRFVVVEPPRHGVIKRNGEERHWFNMADLKSKLVVYSHDGGTETTDNLKFLVKIENFQSQGMAQVLIMSDVYQHSPKVVNNKVASVEEHDLLTLTPALLNVTHPAGSLSCIKFSITSPPKHGRLSLVGRRETTEVQTFMQEDINAGRVKYRHVDRGQLSDVFQFDVQCGASVLAGLEFVIDVIPAIIPLEVLNTTVEEGEFAYISVDIIQIISKFYRNQPVELLVVTEPRNGRILNLNLTPGAKASQFSMEDVREHKIMYVHDGSETLSDKFTLMANLQNKISDSKTVHVVILPRNDEPPEVIMNAKLEVWSGSATAITKEHLYARDADTGPDDIVYHVRHTANGSISLFGDESERSINNFTQADVDSKQVIFMLQEGTDEGQFEFYVTDGVAMTESMIFHIESKSLLLFIEISQSLQVFPGLIQPITSSHLKAATNDSNHSHPIVYTIQTKPTRGRLVAYDTDGLREVTSFLQDELNANVILYEHNVAMAEWSEEDSFTYNVRTAYAPSIGLQFFDISISYDNINEYNKDRLMTLRGTAVDEGGNVVLSKSELDLSTLKNKLVEGGLKNFEVNLIILELPLHGALRVQGRNAIVGSRFVQEDINRGHVVYFHDHSDVLLDAFSFAVELESTPATGFRDGFRQLPHSVNTFTITIRPVNDQPFVLQTQSPTIKLIQGFTKNITRSALLTEDLDTLPDAIKYEIITPPSNGFIINANHPNQSATTFTQRDIDENLIFFVHDGSRDSGAFYFRVSDGGHKPLYKVFNICVIPLSMELVGPSAIELLQGEISCQLLSTNLNVHTNGRKDRIFYNITKGPQHGSLYLYNNIAEHFSQADIEEGKVTYIQTDLNYHSDFIEFTLFDIYNVFRNRRLEMIVRPRVKKSRTPFRVGAGDVAVLTVEALDASELARASGDDPVYYVTVMPQHGLLTKANPSNHRVSRRNTGRRKSKNKETRKKADEVDLEYMKNSVVNFTHDDIVNGRVLYQSKASAQSEAVVRDSFMFYLTAKNAQPVPMTFEIDVHQTGSNNGGNKDGQMPVDSTTSAADGNSAGVLGISSNDHMKIIFIICGVVLVLIIILIVFKCYRRKSRIRQRQLAAAKEDSKSPLADPSSPHSMTSEPSEGGVENRVQSLNSVKNAPIASGVPVINVTPDTPTQGRRNFQNRLTTEAIVEPNPAIQRSVAPLETSKMVSPNAVHIGRHEKDPVLKLANSLHRQASLDGFGGKKELSAFDWENVDPELLEHCRKTTPVLHKNQYWV